MIKKTIKNSNGVTLIDLMIAIAISIIIVAAVLMSTRAGQQASTGIEQKISIGQDVRATMDTMSMEIAMASYNPLGTVAWLGSDCHAAGVALNRGIQVATPTQLTIEMDINESGAVGDVANEIITYNYDSNNQDITKNINCAGALPWLGDVNTLSGTARNVLVTNATTVANGVTGVPLFRYFDGNGVELFPNSVNTAPIPNIRKIRITVDVQAAASDAGGQKRQAVYSVDVIPRNHML